MVLTGWKFNKSKKEKQMENKLNTREDQIMDAYNVFDHVFEDNEISINPNTCLLYFVGGATWADTHPDGFINDEGYLAKLRSNKERLTNKEFIEMLRHFPEDATISVECCNPRAMIYDEKNNLIRID